MARLDPTGKVFVVTGAGNGIGRQVALELISRGATVAGVDLNGPGLAATAELAGRADRFSSHIVDVSDRDAVDALRDEILSRHLAVDGLFNIAGIAQEMQLIEQTSAREVEKLFAVNFFGSVWMTSAFLPHLRNRPRGVVALTSSLSAIVPFPGSTFYGATKAAIALYGQGLAQDLRSEGRVTATTVIPGTVWTDLVRQSAVDLGTSERLAEWFAMPVEGAARAIVDATLKGRTRALVGKDAKFYEVLSRASTRLADRASYLQIGSFVYRRARG